MCTGKGNSKTKLHNWVKSTNRKCSEARRDETGQSQRTRGDLKGVSFLGVVGKPFAKIRALDAGKQA